MMGSRDRRIRGRRFTRPGRAEGPIPERIERQREDMLRFMDEAEREMALLDAKIKKLEEMIHATANQKSE